PMCCTAPCSVIATGQPKWRPATPRAPAAGGVLGDFQPTPVESDGPLACTGSFWRTQFHVQCVLDAPQTEIIAVTVNETDHCNVHIFMTSAAACTKFTLSGGWMFIGALAAVTFTY
ncbi:unnamed protein product, partial [Symbiodinium sp. KB8]